jgi:hypothetical protein
MNPETLDMFKTLTEFPSAPGFERELRAYVKEAMTPYTDEFVQDRLGSLFGVLRGEANGPKDHGRRTFRRSGIHGHRHYRQRDDPVPRRWADGLLRPYLRSGCRSLHQRVH